jgi:hypothetical protein
MDVQLMATFDQVHQALHENDYAALEEWDGKQILELSDENRNRVKRQKSFYLRAYPHSLPNSKKYWVPTQEDLLSTTWIIIKRT